MGGKRKKKGLDVIKGPRKSAFHKALNKKAKKKWEGGF